MNTIMINVINWLVTSGWLAAFFVFLWKLIKPLLEDKRKYAKTAQDREKIEMVERLADMAVSSLAGNDDITGHDKFKAATSYVNGVLAQQGHLVSQETVNHAVQAAYEKSDLTPTSTEAQPSEPTTGTVINGQSAEDPVLKAVEQAPNRANDVEEG